MVRGSVLFGITRSSTAGLGFLAGLFLYRVLGPEEAGKFQLVFSASTTVGTILSLGFFETLARFVPERTPAAGAGLLRRSLRFNTYAIILAAAVFAGILFSGLPVPVEFRLTPVALMVCAAAYAMQNTLLGMFRGLGRLNLISWLEMGRNFGGRLAALALAPMVVFGFAPAIRAFSAAQLVVLIFSFFLLRRFLTRGETRFTGTETRVGRLFLMSEVLSTLIVAADIYILRVIMDPHDVGIYAAGIRPSRLGRMLLLGPLMVPLLYYFSHPESSYLKEKIVGHGARISGAMMGFAGLVLVVLAKPLVNIFLGSEFAESVPVLQAYSAYGMAASMQMFMTPYFHSINKPQYSIYLKIATLVLSVGLAVLMVPSYGTVGAAVAGVIGVSLATFLAAVFLRVHTSIRMVLSMVFLLGLYGGCYWLASTGMPLLALIVYLAALIPLGLVRRSDIQLMKSVR